MKFIIERLNSKSADRAAQIVNLFHREKTDATYLRRWLACENHFLLAGFFGEEPAGMLVAYELSRVDRQKTMFFIYEIDVLEKYRRRRLGKALIEYMKKRCAQADCLKMFVVTNESNLPAMKLYETTGGNRKHGDDVVFEF